MTSRRVLASSRALLVEQALHALEVLLGALQVGPDALDLRLELGDVLLAGAHQTQAVLGRRLVALGPDLLEGQLEVRGRDGAQHLPRADHIALLDQEGFQAARNLGGDPDVGGLDVAARQDLRRVGAWGAAAKKECRDGRGRGGLDHSVLEALRGWGG